MIAIELSVEDLTDVTFAVSPMAETVFSLWQLAYPSWNGLHQPWRDAAHQRLDPRGLARALPVVEAACAIPDFLTPRPDQPSPGFDEELARVVATPPAVVRRDVVGSFAAGRLPATLAPVATGDDDAVRTLLRDLGDQLDAYWRAAVEPWWPRVRALLEADVAYRARRLTTGGSRLMFADLHPQLAWHDATLEVESRTSYRSAAAGRGLMLVPSVFAQRPAPPLGADSSPWLAYPARGLATLWETPRSGALGSLPSLLGRSRADLLVQLDEPRTTTELAHQWAVTPSAVSQHLQVLHANGLLARVRDGRRVLYRRSPLGHELVRSATMGRC